MDRISDRELFDARYVVYRSDRYAETSGKCRGGGVLLAVNKRLHARRLSGQQRQLIADTLCVKVAAPPPHSHHALYINVVYFPPNNVIEAINEMKSKRSSGPDNIPSYVVKGYGEVLAEPLCYLFNLSLSSFNFPQRWKEAKRKQRLQHSSSSLVEVFVRALISLEAKYFDGTSSDQPRFLD
ncbi:hypothetical protein J6590_063075 [Homalodisca vitripennis]|nr:hypothetical protein J6590_063075 [Homalodisca vitripennis]